MYQAKVKSKMIINHETGEVKLEKFGVKVDDYSNNRLLTEAKSAYNRDEDLQEKSYKISGDWPEGTWYSIFYRMFEKFWPWKKEVYKNKKKNRKKENNKNY